MAENTQFYKRLQVASHNYFNIEIHLKLYTKLEKIFASCTLLAGLVRAAAVGRVVFGPACDNRRNGALVDCS